MISLKAARAREPQARDGSIMSQIVTLTLNPAVDVSTAVARLEPTVKLRCGPERRDAGGGGINVARVARRLGAEVTAIHPAGGAVGRQLEALLAAEQIAGRAVRIAGETRESFTVLETTTDREYRFVLPGPHLDTAEWAACLDAVPPAALTVASGSLPPGVPPDAFARLALRARAAGGRLAVDTSGQPLRRALEAGVWLAKPNLRELRDLTGEALDTGQARLAAARRIVDDGGARMVALSLGAEGALLVSPDGAWGAPALPVRPVSSVGAGDSFLGALVWALAGGRAPAEALRWAMAAGSAALLAPGTQLCAADDVRRLAPSVEVRPL